MELKEAIRQRHSVRQYTNRPIPSEILTALQTEVDSCNEEGGLHIQLITNEPKAFNSLRAHYGKFSGVEHYLMLIGKKSSQLDERCGYYGERLVLKAQQLGLNTCWVAMTYKKIPSAFRIDAGEKTVAVIPLGYGKTSGASHPIKRAEQVSNIGAETPDWFREGVEAALLAPTAMNQQKFQLTYQNGQVTAKAGKGFYAKVDLGIVKYHFEAVSGRPCKTN